jgi:hypothetical protein
MNSHKKIFRNRKAGKNAQIISIFWSAILIFFIIIESIIVLMMSASRGDNKLEASNKFLSGEIYGPVIPVYILSDDSLSTISKTGTSNDEISRLFRDRLSSLKGYQGFTAEIMQGKIPEDASYGLSQDGAYKEIFYFYRTEDSYIKMILIAKIVRD